jgi:PhnB protein
MVIDDWRLTMQQAVAYLNFGGQCVEAFRLYAEVLGGHIESIETFRDGQISEVLPLAHANRVRHAVMHLDGLTLMGCDGLPGQDARDGFNFALTLDVPDIQVANAAFMTLSEGGTVVTSFQSNDLGRSVGTVYDQFGMLWTIVCSMHVPLRTRSALQSAC